MTVSFHEFGAGIFSATSRNEDTGDDKGKNYALNVPLKDGMDNESFHRYFWPIIQNVKQVYQPDAVVLRSGGNSLAGDMFGNFNLSVMGNADCLHFIRSFNVPLMVLGGGGFTIRNVAHCWCYETAVAIGVELDSNLPRNEYYEYFGPDYSLHVAPNHNMENLNLIRDMETIRNTLLEQLSQIEHAPSVPFQATPSTTKVPEEQEVEMEWRPKPCIWYADNSDSE